MKLLPSLHASIRRPRFAPLLTVPVLVLIAGCQENAPPPQTAQAPPPPVAYPPSPYAPPTTAWSYPPVPGQAPNAAPYPPPAAPQQAYPAPLPPAPLPAPAPMPTNGPARPLLGALVGAAAWQAEVRSVARELVASLSADYQARVATVPIMIDPNPNDVNAFAACSDSGAPYVAATEGLLEAADAIAQTRATDELFGTQTYPTYANTVAPRIVSKGGGSALLPAGIIAPAYWADPRRISRAHEIFDEIVAFTFGHELSHHYLGHTGCAMQQANVVQQAIAQLGQQLTSGPAAFNQPNEMLADNYGCRNTLDTGLARSSAGYRWTEGGGLLLLDFLEHLSRASGAGLFVSILLSHPDPALRIPLVQGAAASWHLQHPG
jgi:hypothetical protein